MCFLFRFVSFRLSVLFYLARWCSVYAAARIAAGRRCSLARWQKVKNEARAAPLSCSGRLKLPAMHHHWAKRHRAYCATRQISTKQQAKTPAHLQKLLLRSEETRRLPAQKRLIEHFETCEYYTFTNYLVIEHRAREIRDKWARCHTGNWSFVDSIKISAL